MLLQLCARFGLTITNTLFKHPDIHKGTWQHPRSKNWHMIDLIIVSQHYRSDVIDCRVRRSADCWTDHKMQCARLNLRFHISRQNSSREKVKRINTSSLCHEDTQKKLASKLTENLTTLQGSVEEQWQTLRDTTYSSAAEVLGYKTRQHRDWFDESNVEIQELLHAKQAAFDTVLQQETPINRQRYRDARNHCQREIRRMKNRWWELQAAEIEEHANKNNSKQVFEGIKLTAGRRTTGLDPIDSSDGVHLTQKDDILSRWREHFSTLLNQHSNADPSVLDSIPQAEVDHSLEVTPTEEELVKALSQLASGKAPGPDAIPAEVLKNGGHSLISGLHTLLKTIWEAETTPQDFRNGTLVKLFKKKCKYTCGNYHGITLLSIVGKLVAKVILNRIWPTIEQHLPEAQCSFRRGRSTVDMFVLRQLQEKCREQRQELHLIFIDLVKGFDTVNRDIMWQLLRKIGIPDKIVNIIQSFHEGMRATVQVGGESTEEFEVTCGLRQGCILAPSLFILFFAYVVRHATKELPADDGISMRYRTDGDLFNIRRLRAKKASTTIVNELLYADDACAGRHDTRSLQSLTDSLNTSCKQWGLTISQEKTEVFHQQSDEAPAVTLEGKPLTVAKSDDCQHDKEISQRISKASRVFHSLKSKVWERNGITIRTKLLISCSDYTYTTIWMWDLDNTCAPPQESWTLSAALPQTNPGHQMARQNHKHRNPKKRECSTNRSDHTEK